jgi:hypothetical protein
MGQAKQRGSYEQRREIAIEKQQRRPKIKQKPLSPKAALFLSAASALMEERHERSF